jgi:endonuclease III
MKDERIRALRAGADRFRRTPSLVEDLSAGFARALRAARRIPHLGRASTLRLLLFSAGHPVLPLDEHALRVARRLGYGVDDERSIRVLRLTRKALITESGEDVDTLRALSQYLTHHGLAACTQAAPHCNVCPLAPDCEWLRRQ